MGGVIRLDLGNLITIALVAFAGDWAIDKLLNYAGLGQYNTSNA